MPVRRKRDLSNSCCVIAVLFGGLATRIWHTYLPAQADDLAKLASDVGQTVAIVQRAAGDLPQLEEQTYKDRRCAASQHCAASHSPEDG